MFTCPNIAQNRGSKATQRGPRRAYQSVFFGIFRDAEFRDVIYETNFCKQTFDS